MISLPVQTVSKYVCDYELPDLEMSFPENGMQFHM